MVATGLRRLVECTHFVGRRYRRQDEVGTPFCLTVDGQTLEDGTVTLRERDSMQQERIAIEGISGYFAQRFLGA